MTAYELVPVGAKGVEEDRAQRIDIPTYSELALQNERLKQYLEAARLDVAEWREMWAAAHDRRCEAETRADRAARVLAAMGREVPAAVRRARREIWRLDE